MKIKIFKAAVLVAVIFMLLPLKAVGQANTYYDKGQEGETPNRTPLKSRMALVGHNCMVSSLSDGIAVGSGSKNLSYLCDENLDNYYTIPSVANATLLAGSPIVAVKDMKHYIDKDTKAGFKISGESNVLKLEVLKANYHIRFYRDGKILKTSAVEQLGFTVLNLSVGNIDLGNNAVDIIAAEQPDQDYDEIALVGQDGIKVDVVKGLKIYYAFVGDAEYTLTNPKIQQYDKNITLNAKSSTHSVPTLIHDLNYFNRDLIDDDLTNGIVISALLQLGSSGYAQVIANNGKSTETFPAGTEAGFVYSDGALIGAGVTPVIYLLDKNGNEIYKKAIETTVLSVSIAGKQKKVSIKAPMDFSGIKFRTMGVEVANGVTANYAFIVPKPITAGHQCEMNPTASLDLCNCDSHYQLKWDEENFPNVRWDPAEPLPNGVTFDSTNNTLDFSETDSYKNGTGEKVTVKMKLTNLACENQCSQTITINYGGSTEQKPEDKKKETVLYNADPANPIYELGGGTSAGINLLTFVKNSSNIISSKLNSYASYFGGVTIGDAYICGVKKKNGKIFDEINARQSGERQVGFVVTTKTALNADVLDMFNVRLYNNGEKVEGGIASSAIAANLIGSQDTHKVRFSINVPAGTIFDEIRLYTSGVLGAKLSVMNIYYAYTADANAVLDDPLEHAEAISFDNTNATINQERTQSIAVANLGNGLKDITNCIDSDPDNTTIFPGGVNAVGGSVLAIKLGVTATRNKQLVVVVDKKAFGLNADVVNALVVKTYNKGGKEPVETFSDWSILGTNILTLGDKGYIFINPKSDYDEVAITQGDGIKLLDALAVYGLYLRNDKDGDGTPDDDELAEDCKQDLVFQETVNLSEKSQKKYKENLTMYFQRSFVKNEWNSLIMPVDLTKAQFDEAFGSDAKLAKANKVYDSNGNLVIGFSLVEEDKNNANSAYLVANTPYIINISKKTALKGAITIDAGTISGDIYKVDNSLAAGGVTFTYDNDKATNPIEQNFPVDQAITTKWGMTDLKFIGSYDNHQNLEVGNYIWNNGKLYLTKNNHWMKGYRCWLVPTWSGSATGNAKLLTFGFGNGETTGINMPSMGNTSGSTKVYNLNGQRVDNMLGVQPGIYIVNGKKVVVK
ncbi:hypothetical protein KUA50_010065 [Segatella hominis]|uniref:hypothetical protein n=1 Tax=Segatella hominis TaxID=2518605 RepID=UPI001C488900|nr:hypothetical protein [Segatella hominis]WOZ80406.1 hypothetical protein KUA50_010065 [Segatella hominis]